MCECEWRVSPPNLEAELGQSPEVLDVPVELQRALVHEAGVALRKERENGIRGPGPPASPSGRPQEGAHAGGFATLRACGEADLRVLQQSYKHSRRTRK